MGVLHWIGVQFTGSNLFQTLALLLVLAFSLPTFMLDRIVNHFAVHRRIKPEQVSRVLAAPEGGQERTLPEQEAKTVLDLYQKCAFIQKRDQHTRAIEPPFARIELKSGERIVIHEGARDLDIMRTDKTGTPVVTYWARNDTLKTFLHCP